MLRLLFSVVVAASFLNAASNLILIPTDDNDSCNPQKTEPCDADLGSPPEKKWTLSKITQLWHEEKIYFLPSNPDILPRREGEIYDYSRKRCFHSHPPKDAAESIEVHEAPCSSEIKARALFPYEKISDFTRFKTRFLKCLDNVNQKCLRGLISKTAQLSFGFDPASDRRDFIFQKWKKTDYQRLAELIRKGTAGSENEKTFPPQPPDAAAGWRGQFQKIDGGWRLTYFLAGD